MARYYHLKDRVTNFGTCLVAHRPNSENHKHRLGDMLNKLVISYEKDPYTVSSVYSLTLMHNNCQLDLRLHVMRNGRTKIIEQPEATDFRLKRIWRKSTLRNILEQES